MYDVIIIGAGPAGCRTAELLAKDGKSVLVIEEHEKVGNPVQCTGLISHKLLVIHQALPKSIIQNKIKTARFFAPNGTNFSLSVKKPALVVDRVKLDKWLAEKAKKAGAKFKLKTRFLKFRQQENKIIVETNGSTFECQYLIGADGVLSNVRKQMKLDFDYHQQIFSQKTKTKTFKQEAQLSFGGEYFNWIVPVSKTKARIGGPSKEQKFKGTSGGVVRYGLIPTAQKENVFLVGDAALQVKPFSCGGVVYGQIAARCLAEAILKNKNYDDLWKKELEGSIRKGLFLCQFYTFPNWLQNLAFEIIVRTNAEKLLENLDIDFY
jgi:digeranylgeranylglycerophospholipid reductase